MNIKSSIYLILEELSGMLNQLQADHYSKPCDELSGSTIGQHTRHIIELFQCLLNQYDSGLINYDLRARNKIIENDKGYAILCLTDISLSIEKPDKSLKLVSECGEFQTNYYRELLYNIEHCIHHQALIKVALLSFDSIPVSEEFGVAPSTIKFRKLTSV